MVVLNEIENKLDKKELEKVIRFVNSEGEEKIEFNERDRSTDDRVEIKRVEENKLQITIDEIVGNSRRKLEDPAKFQIKNKEDLLSFLE